MANLEELQGRPKLFLAGRPSETIPKTWGKFWGIVSKVMPASLFVYVAHIASLSRVDETSSSEVPHISMRRSSALKAQLALKDAKIELLTRNIEEIDREILREERIQELQRSLQQRDFEIQNLRSQLDKFQSVLVVCNPASPKGLTNNVRLRPRKQRAGISAEPQNEASILELSQQTFPTIYKSER
ncbi:hypothetical protein NQ315_005624 [Exocentrus adspersus]|uniref:cGMP-dependent protein kinase N-terminal coiled-coil domain-containing protein n=1 Tax=Exocentrus adspersus TaxID=1586481 RepID=A0AAV8V5U9_9CUCU|nr:hypothetical protein NQ315_005624 [Exocentrus adspersus]